MFYNALRATLADGSFSKLYTDRRDVLHGLDMAHSSTDVSIEKYVSYGTHVFHHLAANAACLAGGQVAVIAASQVDADFACCLHLELVHCLPCLGDVQLIVIVAHIRSLLFEFPGKRNQLSGLESDGKFTERFKKWQCGRI